MKYECSNDQRKGSRETYRLRLACRFLSLLGATMWLAYHEPAGTAAEGLSSLSGWRAMATHSTQDLSNSPSETPSQILDPQQQSWTPADPVRSSFEKLPLYFIENQGQVDSRVAFYVQGSKTSVYFTVQGITFVLSGPTSRESQDRKSTVRTPKPATSQRWAVNLDFVGANTDTRPIGRDRASAVVSYFKGQESEWKRGLPTYGAVVYPDLWPGIDLIYAGTSSRLKYTFVVQPGADAGQIRLAYRGATDVRLTEEGRLAVTTPVGGFEDDTPYAYQETGNQRSKVESTFVLEDDSDNGTYRYGFWLGPYDRSKPLILDPVILAYCGYIGGSLTDEGHGIAVDRFGNAYVTGYTTSGGATFPVTTGPDPTYNDSGDAFVAKVNSSGTALVYCGYIGGSASDYGWSIAVDDLGNAYVTGETTSGNFPSINAPGLGNLRNGPSDAFVTKVDASGSGLLYSGYLGGDNSDSGHGIAVNALGSAYVTGFTNSPDFPDTLASGYSGLADAFVTRVRLDASGLDYSRYVGGSSMDSGEGIALDSSNNAYVVGQTQSNNLPAMNFPYLAFGEGLWDAFVAKVDPFGTISYCGYIGGEGEDRGFGIAVDGLGNAYVTGQTNSRQDMLKAFPLRVGPDSTYNGDPSDAFVAKVKFDGSGLDYSGYIGGNGEDCGYGVGVDGNGSAYVAGYTTSDTGFPVKGGPSLLKSNGAGYSDAFVAKVEPSGASLDYCGYLGGTEDDSGRDIAVTPSGSAYITGLTFSSDFPVTVGPDLTYNNTIGWTDAFVAKVESTSIVKLVGFETGDGSELDSVGNADFQPAPVRPGSGNYRMWQGDSSTLPFEPSELVSGLSPALNQLALRFSFLKTNNFTFGHRIMRFVGSTGNQWSLFLRSDGHLEIQDEDSIVFSGTTVGTTTLVNNMWYTIRLVYDTVPGGILRVWLGRTTLDIDLTHVSGGAPIDTIEIHGWTSGFDNYYDDFYLADTADQPPLGQIVRIGPDGDNLFGFDSPFPSPNHYENVNEVPPDDMNYNWHQADFSATDLYSLGDSPSGVINAVKGMWQMKAEAPALDTHHYAWRESDVNMSAEFTGLLSNWQRKEIIWPSPPNSGGLWTTSKVDGLELGAMHREPSNLDTYISWTAAMVDYDLNPPPLYRSVGTNGIDLNTGRTVEISGTTATFSGPMADNVGVGDVLQYQVGTYYLAFIHGRTSDTVYTVKSSTGGMPQAAGLGTEVRVYRAYTSLFNWEAQDENDNLDNSVEDFDTSTDLVTGGTVMMVACYGDGPDTTAVTIDGWTTALDNYIRIYTPVSTHEVGTSQRHNGKWDNSKYRLETVDFGIRIGTGTSGAGNVWIDGLQFHLLSVSGDGNSALQVDQTTVANHRISNNILQGVTNNSYYNYGINLYAGPLGSVVRIWNNIIYDFDGTIRGNGIGIGDPDFTAYVYNNTVYNCSYGYYVGVGTVIAKNNISYSNTDNYYGPFDLSSTNNLSGPSQMDAPGPNFRHPVMVTFVDESNDDFHLAPTDTGAKDYGVNLSSDPNLKVYGDIDGKLRVDPWDIGADDVDATTAVELIALKASGYDGKVLLEWETGAEVDNLGFFIYRAESEEGPFVRVNDHLVPGLGSSPVGAAYRYLDSGLTNGKTYYYQVEDFELSGKTNRYGPVSATPQAGAFLGEGGNTSPSEPPESEPPSPVGITYGDPSETSFRVLRQGRGNVVLELETGGFYAEPLEDGTVRLEVPGFVNESETGEPSLPVKRAWVEALAGRKVKLTSVTARHVEVVRGLRPALAEAPGIDVSDEGTIQAHRRRVRLRQDSVRGGLYPEEAARVVETAFQGEFKKALLELAPLRWNEERGELILSRWLLVRLTFTGREVAEKSLGGSLGRKRPARAPRGEGREVVARFSVQERGLYRVRFEEAMGRRREVPANSLRLSRLGEPVSFHLEPDNGRWGPGSALYFFSEGGSLTPYSHDVVYELEIHREGTSMPVVEANPSGPGMETCLATVEREENRMFASTWEEADWLWDSVFALTQKSFEFEAREVDPSAVSSGRLDLWVHGVSLEDDTPYGLRFYLNDHLVGDTHWTGDGPRHVEMELLPGWVQDGINTLTLENLTETYSTLVLDRFAVSYMRRAVGDEGVLEGIWTESGTAEVRGLSGLSPIVDTTEEPARWLRGTVTADSVRFAVEAGRRYLVVSEEAVQTPQVERAGLLSLRAPRRQADYLIIGPRELLGTAEPLLELRRSQGLRAQAVALEDVYAEFGYGEMRPEAIREFLQYAYHQWREPSPRFVVLLGDGNYDYKNYLGVSEPQKVPPLLVKTSYMWTASDTAYAAVNGDDQLPDLAIGRLPATTVEEARVMVEKIVAYETGGGSFSAPFVLVADNADGAGDFPENAEEIARGALSAWKPQRIFLGELGTEATRAAVVEAFDTGASLMSYIGHGGYNLWAKEKIFMSSQVGTLLTQPQQPIVLTMTCMNGYFHLPYYDSLAEELLKAEGKGAVAAFSPSGLSLNTPAHSFHKALLGEIVSGHHSRLGDAILAAQTIYTEEGAFLELLSIFHLFGDPAMPLVH